jgi:hypothetical protein
MHSLVGLEIACDALNRQPTPVFFSVDAEHATPVDGATTHHPPATAAI